MCVAAHRLELALLASKAAVESSPRQDTSSTFYLAVQAGLEGLRQDFDQKLRSET